MEQIIKLDREDIRRLIAKEFDVKVDQVSVSIEKTYKGYGIYEHLDYDVCVTIRK